jgi:5'-nucleotidase
MLRRDDNDSTPPQPLHGGIHTRPSQPEAVQALQEAVNVLSDPELARLLEGVARVPVERARQVFVNRNLRLGRVEMVGFDMDYTLAVYHLRRIEQLSFDLTVSRLVTDFGYPSEVGLLQYDHGFVMRGLVVDKLHGNLIKLDRFGSVGRAYHGLSPLPVEVCHRLYRNERIRLTSDRYAWIDTLFSLPEAWLYAAMIGLLEHQDRTLDYGKLYDDVREAIDSVHRDNSLKREVRKDIARYIFRDPELGPTLHKLRSGGKKLFLLTNSLWDYTDAVMAFLLDGVLHEYPSWRNYFDVIVTGAAKPAFFTEGRPFLELDPNTHQNTVLAEATTLERWKVYQGGNLPAMERMTGISGEKVLYVGDHIYGDILRSRKASLWRTCMVVQELEDEIRYTDGRAEEISRLGEVELLIARLDDELNVRKGALNSIERKLERPPPDLMRAAVEEERRKAKADLERVRRALKSCNAIADVLERDVELGFNPFWGLLFKEGNENSRFGSQVEQYACLYTSRVSNFLYLSPMQYLRAMRDKMPHEHAGAMSGKLSPLGGEGPPKAAQRG